MIFIKFSATIQHFYHIEIHCQGSKSLDTLQNLLFVTLQILKRGAHVNDRDGLTDMTLLHYAAKSGAAGIGDAESAMRVVSMLIDAGADVNIRCRWTNMTALHYAAYFDVVPVLKVLLKATKALGEVQFMIEFLGWF